MKTRLDLSPDKQRNNRGITGGSMANDSVEQLNRNGNKRGNPAWVKGKSANPRGRPKGKNSLATFYHDSDLFFIRHLRWERFCFEYIMTLRNGAKAARRVGYSRKSARFIASRLLKKPIIRATLMRINEVTSLDRRTLASLLERGDLWKWDPATGKRKD